MYSNILAKYSVYKSRCKLSDCVYSIRKGLTILIRNHISGKTIP